METPPPPDGETSANATPAASTAPDGETSAIAASTAPVTPADVAAALTAAGIRPGGIVIVHSSLSRLGWVVGGAQTIVEGLLAATGADGTIVMPAHTGVSDPAGWSNPPVPEAWWDTIRATWPAFDPALTPMRGMGAVVEAFRRLDGVVHSGHPALGFVARGPRADRIVHPHHLDAGFGDTSPLGRLYAADATVLLIGVGHGNNTSLHLAEHRAGLADAALTTQGAPLLVDGERRWVTYSAADHDAADFERLGEAFATTGDQRRIRLGSGTVTTCRMVTVVDFATRWLAGNRG